LEIGNWKLEIWIYSIILKNENEKYKKFQNSKMRFIKQKLMPKFQISNY